MTYLMALKITYTLLLNLANLKQPFLNNVHNPHCCGARHFHRRTCNTYSYFLDMSRILFKKSEELSMSQHYWYPMNFQ